MAGADKDQKTEDPTDKKIADAHAKGDIAFAPEVKHAAMFAAAIVVTGGLGTWTFMRLGQLCTRLWGAAEDFRLTSEGGQGFATSLLAQLALLLAPLLATLVGFALLGGVLQGRPSISWSRVAPKLSKVSPIAGFQRIFGARAAVEFGKTLAKLMLVVAVATFVVWPKAVSFDRLVGVDPGTIAITAGHFVTLMVKAVATLAGALALFDFVYQRRSWLARMRMSLQEIKDERKDSDGDPKIKAKIRAIGFQRARRRMMQAVPTASVVITNPTHYAIALRYDHGKMGAPVVVAKGLDAIAMKIREVAVEAGVPIVESPPLARALYAAVEIDQSVPMEHYAAVAEIIGYVMRLAKRQR